MTTNLQIASWPIEKLIPYARNARTHSDEQIAQIAASIAEFGWTNPVLVGLDGVLIAGHASTKITEEYTVVQLKRQEELSREEFRTGSSKPHGM